MAAYQQLGQSYAQTGENEAARTILKTGIEKARVAGDWHAAAEMEQAISILGSIRYPGQGSPLRRLDCGRGAVAVTPGSSMTVLADKGEGMPPPAVGRAEPVSVAATAGGSYVHFPEPNFVRRRCPPPSGGRAVAPGGNATAGCDGSRTGCGRNHGA